MSWSWLDPLSLYSAPFVLTALFVSSAVLALTRTRGGWLAPLLALNFFLLAAEAAALSWFALPPARVQVLVMRLMELPVVSTISAMCLSQAGVLAWRRRPALPFGEVARRPELRKVLVAAPVALFAAWALALVGEMIWPVPAYDPFASMPLRNFLLITPLCVPTLFYLALLSWLFGKAAGRRTPSLRLRGKNLFFSLGTFAYFLMNLNVVVGFGVLTFAPDGLRETITRAQFVVEDELILVITVTIPLGLALGSAPVAYEVLRRAYYPLMELRPKLEARNWQLSGASEMRGLTQALYHANTAANLLAMPEADWERTVTTVELLWTLVNAPTSAPEMNEENMRRLLVLQRELFGETPLTNLMRPSKTLDYDLNANQPPPEDPFSDALEATLALAGHGVEARSASERFGRSPWFQLAAVVAENAGIAHALKTPANETTEMEITRHRAARAYQAAQQAAATGERLARRPPLENEEAREEEADRRAIHALLAGTLGPENPYARRIYDAR
jgi:hypothetical protein